MGLFCSNYTAAPAPSMPSYGEGMRDALEAQVDLLSGTGDFADTGGLQSLVEQYEAPLRQSTAQIDTDVLRQTILGDVTEAKESEVTYDDSGRIIRGYKEGPSYEVRQKLVGQVSQIRDGKQVYSDVRDLTNYSQSEYEEANRGNEGYTPINSAIQIELVDPDGKVVAYSEESISIKDAEEFWNFKNINFREQALTGGNKSGYDFTTEYTKAINDLMEEIPESVPDSVTSELQKNIENRGQLGRTTALDQVKISTGEGSPIYATDSDGKIIQDESKAGTTETRVLPAQRAEDGMIDLLGDKQLTDDGRKPGFDAQGNFLGLSALAEDIQAGNLSRQRERDLADVERLSGRFQDVMEDYRPGTAEAVTGAREVLESQKDRLTGEGQITVPTDDTFGGAATPATLTAAQLGEGPTLDADTTYDAATAADPMALNAATSFTPSAGVTGEGFTATAGLEGGQIQADPLREALMAQAQAGLTEGLTDREERQIAEAARARSTMMGRTFDQSGAIAEAEARVLEDRNRQNQNRAFAQQILGQEAGLQESDLSRGLQAAMQNQSALNRASEFGAGQDMQAQLANQAATNQALQAGMAAGLSQEALGAQQQQAREFANMQAQNRASEFGTQAGMQQDLARAGIQQERDALQAQLDQQGAAFGAEAAQQAALADQRQKQQAAQFGVGAEMDAERLNAQLAQQGALGYVDAATRLASLEDQTTMDPFAALLNRAGGGSLQAGQGVFGQANYGLSSGPQYLNPEAGLGFISQMAANEASMYGAQQAANASRSSGLMGGLGSLFGGAAGGLLGNTNLFK